MRKYLFKRNQSFNTNTGGAGFSLIEIILTIAIMSIIAGTSYTALVKFNSQQSLNSAYENFKNNLNLAKSLASSQVTNCTSSQTLVGYQMYFPDSNTYKIDSVCQASSGPPNPTPELRNARTSNLTDITISYTKPTILFQVISGEVQDLSPGEEVTITLTGSNGSKRSITVFPNGRIE